MVIPVYDDNPVRRPSYVTGVLIAINAIIFLISPAKSPVFASPTEAQTCEQRAFFERWGAVPTELVHERTLSTTVEVGPDGRCHRVSSPHHKIVWLSVFTSLFIHGGWLHLLGNMLFLAIFGDNVEDRFGRLRFLLFYLIVGAGATYTYAFISPDQAGPLVGASGAIAGALGAYLVLYPRVRVLGLVSFLFFLPLKIPAWIVLGLWFALQAVYAKGAGLAGGDVAYLVHIVGFSAGVVYTLLMRRRFRDPPRERRRPEGPRPPLPPPVAFGL